MGSTGQEGSGVLSEQVQLMVDNTVLLVDNMARLVALRLEESSNLLLP